MYIRNFAFWFICNTFWQSSLSTDLDTLKSDSKINENAKNTYTTNSLVSTGSNDNPSDTCTIDDFACLALAASDRLGLEAIKSLHQKLDDDANGNVDLSESDDFLREELKYDSGYEKRQKAFHRNDDMHISVKELWEAWLRSEVHNWTIEQTSEWLALNVELPQYVPNFIQHKITGSHLPRMAVNSNNYLSALGIKDPIHKHKISLKAMDVVLFGPPKDQAHWKDLILIILILGVGFGSWYGFQQNKKFRNHLNRMNRDMDNLQNAEKALQNLQKELLEARQAQESVINEKETLEKKLLDPDILHNSSSDLEITQLKQEIDMLKRELQLAEGELKDRCWAPPISLQQWLQLTYEIENKGYIKKKLSAEKQLQQAREACEKLRKKRSSLVGAFVSTHGKSIDEVDRSIVEARTSLNEVTGDLQERMHRWKQIEQLCGFGIMNNNGIQSLENYLYRNGTARGLSARGRMSSQDDLDDDTGSIYGQPGSAEPSSPTLHSWKDGDSSESETSKQDEDSHADTKSPGHGSARFTIGGEHANWLEEKHASVISGRVKPNYYPRSISNNNIAVNPMKNIGMVRSLSQEISLSTLETLPKTKSSQSDNCLEHHAKTKSPISKTIREQPAPIEDDICSTDSSLMDEDIKKKKRKFFNFAKKKPQDD